MTSEKDMRVVKVDWYTRTCLTAIAVLLTVLVIGLWSDAGQWTPRAQAQDKFVNADSRAAIDQGRWGTASAAGKMAAVQVETNDKLDELIQLFKSGEAKVVVLNADSGTGGGDAAGFKKQK